MSGRKSRSSSSGDFLLHALLLLLLHFSDSVRVLSLLDVSLDRELFDHFFETFL